MSAIDTPLTVDADRSLASPQTTAPWLQRFEAFMVWISERLNPILVKECRQALKSRQFSITFALVLLCGWGWSILGVASYGPDIYYSFAGSDLFYGYYLILAFPLTVIVPYVAFRSLAAEVEDRTYELLSITTLRPRQIIGGKLISAMVQMVVYFSAMAPCLAFTYMLRGIDVLTIAFVLFYIFLISLGLSIASLLIATITQERHWQIVLSVALVLALAGAFFMSCGFGYAAIEGEFDLGHDEGVFWVVHAGIVSLGLGYYTLFFVAAASQITFATDNRSTPLRMVMIALQLIFTGWMAWLIAHWAPRDMSEFRYTFVIYLTFIGLHWFLMGSLMIGESPQLSSRVKRSLPQSFLGRMFFTWFNPGPGTGYVFALVNLLAATAIVAGSELIWLSIVAGGPGQRPETAQIAYFAALGFCYVVIYLGIGRLILMALRRAFVVTLPLALLLEILLLLIGCGAPLIVYWMSELRLTGYSLLHASNPIFSLVNIFDKNTLPVEAPALLLLLTPIALLVFLANLPSIVAEVRHVRVAKPVRVTQEDAEIDALLHPVVAKPSSPWD